MLAFGLSFLMPRAPAPDLALVTDLLGARPGASARFIDAACPVLWSVVQRLEPAGADAEAAFLEIIEALQVDGYARLKLFDGRAPLSTYLVLVARDILSRRLARRLA